MIAEEIVFQMILYGADYNPEQWPEDLWLDDMRLMKLANVNMVSINIFCWAMLEPRPEHYQFDQLDLIMDMLAEHGTAADLATATATPVLATWYICSGMMRETYEPKVYAC